MDTAAPKGHAMLTDTAKRLGQIISFLKPTLEGKFVWNNSSECFKHALHNASQEIIFERLVVGGMI